MALAFRAFLHIGEVESSNIEELFWDQYRDWLINSPTSNPRNLDVDLIKPNAVTNFNQDCNLVYGEIALEDGARAIRTTLNEDKDSGRWVTTVTLYLPTDPDHSPCMLFEGDSPYRQTDDAPTRTEDFSTPRLLVRLLDVLQLHDGSTRTLPLSSRARKLTIEEVPALVDTLFDEQRQGPVFLARYPNRVRGRDTLGVLDELTRYSVAVGSTFLLTEDAAVELDKSLSPFHGIQRNSMRTFLPEIELNSAPDARVHKTLALSSIASGDLDAVQRRLGEAARNSTLFAQLPDWFSAIESELVKLEVELLAEGARSNSASVEASALEQALSRTIHVTDASSEVVTAPETSDVVIVKSEADEAHADLALHEEIVTQLRSDLSSIQAKVYELEQKLQGQTRALVVAEQARSQLAKTLSAESSKIAALQADLDQTRRDRNDLAREVDDAYENIRHLQAVDRMRRGQLVKHGLVEQAEIESVEADPGVNSFAEIADLLRQHAVEEVEFTGDFDDLRALDTGTLGSRASRVWDILQVFKDYVLQRRQGFAGDLRMYLEDDTHYGMKLPVSTLKRGESTSTDQHRRRRESRMCPVPSTVSPSGEIYMDAHISFGRRGRIHFHDDTSSSLLPKIYVGYIGYHLETTQS